MKSNLPIISLMDRTFAVVLKGQHHTKVIYIFSHGIF